LVSALVNEVRSPYFVYISTACVFPGDDPDRYYQEDDLKYPCNFYGLTKSFGELMAETLKDVLIIRTNFAQRGPWKHPMAFTDRYGTYLYADQVASVLLGLVMKRETGVLHICGDKRMSMYEFARLADHDVRPTTLSDYSGPRLTVNMCLRSSRIAPISFSP
jgi:dTDP-4-dehydrorhamnose reductase